MGSSCLLRDLHAMRLLAHYAALIPLIHGQTLQELLGWPESAMVAASIAGASINGAGMSIQGSQNGKSKFSQERPPTGVMWSGWSEMYGCHNMDYPPFTKKEYCLLSARYRAASIRYRECMMPDKPG